jgi:Ni/Fe-hydrogenase subunit HybB-like protein
MQYAQTTDTKAIHDDGETILLPGETHTSISSSIGGIVLSPTAVGWGVAIGISVLFLLALIYSITYLIAAGVGIWGINQPVGWGADIINFVWWIGIGHAGTLISAILLLLRQQWRTSINRFAEAMTIFAVCCAGIYPVLHTGRPWVAYWILPYPNTLGMWPQFQSPLAWDVFAISTYATVSVLFWLTGLIPDFALLRDKAQNQIARLFYGIISLGWRGSAKHWHRYELASLLLAGLSTPLVVSVHSIVSLDFAAGILPGWHVTVFPPYFVAGAVFAGFAMVVLLMLPIRKIYHLEAYITVKHFDLMAKVILATGMIVLYGYILELFYAWYSGNIYETFFAWNRMFGPYGWSFWALILCNGVAPQLFWSKRMRQSVPALIFVSVMVSIGMWLERFVIIVGSLYRDFLPSSWGYYTPSFWDWLMYIGTFGLFFTGMFLFIRLAPMIAVSEMHALLHQKKEEEHILSGEHDHAESHGQSHPQTA